MVKAFISYFLFSIVLTSGVYAQGMPASVIKEAIASLQAGSIYLYCRGTLFKNAALAHEFNIADTNITHVGIGYFYNGETKIYNVGSGLAGNALVIDSIASFTYAADLYYFSIWECVVQGPLYQKTVLALNQFASTYIIFDKDLNLHNAPNKLYSAEFCALVLAKINAILFNFKEQRKRLNNKLYEEMLDRKTLEYIPVDFFQQGNQFHKIFEWKSK